MACCRVTSFHRMLQPVRIALGVVPVAISLGGPLGWIPRTQRGVSDGLECFESRFISRTARTSRPTSTLWTAGGASAHQGRAACINASDAPLATGSNEMALLTISLPANTQQKIEHGNNVPGWR